MKQKTKSKSHTTGPLYVLLQDFMKSRSHEIRGFLTFTIAWNVTLGRQQRCRVVCQISEQYDHYNIRSRGFETKFGGKTFNRWVNRVPGELSYTSSQAEATIWYKWWILGNNVNQKLVWYEVNTDRKHIKQKRRKRPNRRWYPCPGASFINTSL